MAQIASTRTDRLAAHSSGGRTKFWIGGGLIISAIVYLIVTTTRSSAQYFLTVDELAGQAGSLNGRNVKVAGAVVGDSIQYDAQNLILTFAVANVPADNDEIEAQGGLAAVLHRAVEDPTGSRLSVVYRGVMPDLLRHEAQAIMTGHLGEDGTFVAEELLLKCPTRYEEALPGQVEG